MLKGRIDDFEKSLVKAKRQVKLFRSRLLDWQRFQTQEERQALVEEMYRSVWDRWLKDIQPIDRGQHG